MSETPTFRSVEGRADYAAAVDSVLARAEREILVLDHDLSEGGWDTAERAEFLRRFCLETPRARVVFVLRELDFVLLRCAHLVGLLRGLGHALEIRTLPASISLAESILLAPPSACLFRVHPDAERAHLALDDTRTATAHAVVFDDAFQHSEPGIPPSTLGLG